MTVYKWLFAFILKTLISVGIFNLLCVSRFAYCMPCRSIVDRSIIEQLSPGRLQHQTRSKMHAQECRDWIQLCEQTCEAQCPANYASNDVNRAMFAPTCRLWQLRAANRRRWWNQIRRRVNSSVLIHGRRSIKPKFLADFLATTFPFFRESHDFEDLKGRQVYS